MAKKNQSDPDQNPDNPEGGSGEPEPSENVSVNTLVEALKQLGTQSTPQENSDNNEQTEEIAPKPDSQFDILLAASTMKKVDPEALKLLGNELDGLSAKEKTAKFQELIDAGYKAKTTSKSSKPANPLGNAPGSQLTPLILTGPDADYGAGKGKGKLAARFKKMIELHPERGI